MQKVYVLTINFTDPSKVHNSSIIAVLDSYSEGVKCLKSEAVMWADKYNACAIQSYNEGIITIQIGGSAKIIAVIRLDAEDVLK